MDATLNFELKHIREELHGINSSLRKIARVLEEEPEDKKSKALKRLEEIRRWEENPQGEQDDL